MAKPTINIDDPLLVSVIWAIVHAPKSKARRKLLAIKVVRELASCSIGEAKQYVDTVVDSVDTRCTTVNAFALPGDGARNSRPADSDGMESPDGHVDRYVGGIYAWTEAPDGKKYRRPGAPAKKRLN